MTSIIKQSQISYNAVNKMIDLDKLKKVAIIKGIENKRQEERR